MSFRRDPAERLIVDSMAMVGELLAAEEARSSLEIAKRYADGPFGALIALGSSPGTDYR